MVNGGKMNNLPVELFQELNEDDGFTPIVCVEHKKYIPCRPCLYQIPATIPYSNKSEDIKIVRDWHLS